MTARPAPPCALLLVNRLMEQRILQVGKALVPLYGALQQVVADTPWIEQYGMGADLGMGDTANPYVRACRAECMLAVLMLHLERVDVDFIDSDRLEVLRDAPSSVSLQAVRTAVMGPAEAAEALEGGSEFFTDD